ncbi:MAG TPA: DUF6178 family protein [Bacteriovoracaceae bacterium]|nr:DUF6178 family protein [Bacteriovoracaceae bacterium]
MTEQATKKDLLSQLLYEAQAYKKFEDIEKLVEAGMDLSMIPVQPLYISLQTTSSDQVAAILPKLSPEQRQALRDIDLWHKDTINPDAAYYWMDVYSKCPSDEVILEYVKSEDFLLSLKNQFTIQTFDSEDPMYPDGDNYFLTEDMQLLIEYPEDFQQVHELKGMIQRLYADIGVEHAYAFLFKMVVDSYQIMEEVQYEEKKERLRDYGFVDYFDALDYETPFLNINQVKDFIKNRKGLTGELDAISSNQSLHASSLVPYQSGLDGLKYHLNLVQNEKRQKYLHFNFIRLVNARMTIEDALKKGSLAISKVGNKTKQQLELGHDFILNQLGPEKADQIFEIFDFVDVYRVGHSLIEITKRKIKRSMTETPFEKDEFNYFLGMYWNSFLENSYEDVTKYKFDGSTGAMEIKDVKSYELWNTAVDTFVAAVPFVQTFFKSLQKLKADGLLNDQFYLNYEVDNIDFEAIMISSFINFVGGHYNEATAGKMGVTIQELKDFYRNFFIKQGQEYLIKGEEDPILRDRTKHFIKKFGLEQVEGFDRYLYQVMLEQLNGYEIDNMEKDDFQHVGGPILLNNTIN